MLEFIVMPHFKLRFNYYLTVLTPLCALIVFPWITYSSAHQPIISIFSLIDLALLGTFCAIALYTIISFAGFLLYDSPAYKTAIADQKLLREKWSPSKKLIISFTSYGDQREVLLFSAFSAAKVLEALDVNYEIELVTDLDVNENLPEGTELLPFVFLKVPPEYATKNGAQFKGRALQYALEQRHLRHADLSPLWILHMDEESILTTSAVAGIHQFISCETNARTIGQGEVQYNSSNYNSNFLTALLDSYRTGEDLGRYRFQFRACQSPYWGVRGSFLLVPASVADGIGYDHQSLTEDVYFALKAATQGIRFGWIEGIVREQSPKTLRDLIGQRRRWLSGLKTMSYDATLPLAIRALAFLNPICWRLAMITLGLLAFAVWSYEPNWNPYFGRIIVLNAWGALGVSYMLGTYRNLEGLNVSFKRRVSSCVATWLLTPVACGIESLIFIYGLSCPAKKFHVIRKQ